MTSLPHVSTTNSRACKYSTVPFFASSHRSGAAERMTMPLWLWFFTTLHTMLVVLEPMRRIIYETPTDTRTHMLSHNALCACRSVRLSYHVRCLVLPNQVVQLLAAKSLHCSTRVTGE